MTESSMESSLLRTQKCQITAATTNVARVTYASIHVSIRIADVKTPKRMW